MIQDENKEVEGTNRKVEILGIVKDLILKGGNNEIKISGKVNNCFVHGENIKIEVGEQGSVMYFELLGNNNTLNIPHHILYTKKDSGINNKINNVLNPINQYINNNQIYRNPLNAPLNSNLMMSNPMNPNPFITNRMMPNPMINNPIINNPMLSNPLIQNSCMPNPMLPNPLMTNQINPNPFITNNPFLPPPPTTQYPFGIQPSIPPFNPTPYNPYTPQTISPFQQTFNPINQYGPFMSSINPNPFNTNTIRNPFLNPINNDIMNPGLNRINDDNNFRNNNDINKKQEEKPKTEEEKLKTQLIKEMDEFQYKNKDKFKDFMMEKSCPICMKSYIITDIIKGLTCKHTFHKSCIEQWLEKHDDCPLCKCNFAEEVKKRKSELEKNIYDEEHISDISDED